MRLTQQLGGQIGRVQTVQLERIVGTVLLFLMGGLVCPSKPIRGVAPHATDGACAVVAPRIDRSQILCWRAPRDDMRHSSLPDLDTAWLL
jgi:hypothetical protein